MQCYPHSFYRRIEAAYIYANRRLLTLMLRGQELLPYLRSMKHFFFLDQSEFLNQFLDTAGSELRKPVQSASMTKIQSLLYMAVSNPASASSLDPHKESLKVTFNKESLFDYLIRITSTATSANQLNELARGLGSGQTKKEDNKSKKDLLGGHPFWKGLARRQKRAHLYPLSAAIDALQFDFEVKFPLNLVISRKTMTRYQLIFRFLLVLRHLELSLTNMWLEHKAPIWRRNSGNPEIEKWKKRIYDLRSQMLQWVQHVLVFATSSVLEVNWKNLEEKLQKVQTVDQLLRCHVEYLDACLKECMLTVEKLLTVSVREYRSRCVKAEFVSV
jgi:gamma-tubulin complex component 2